MNHPQLTPSAGTSAAGPRSDLSVWMGLDLPDPRRDRIAERRTFVEAKQTFMQAAAQADSRLGSVLSRRLRECDDLEDLLRLRFALLLHCAQTTAVRAAPQRGGSPVDQAGPLLNSNLTPSATNSAPASRCSQRSSRARGRHPTVRWRAGPEQRAPQAVNQHRHAHVHQRATQVEEQAQQHKGLGLIRLIGVVEGRQEGQEEQRHLGIECIGERPAPEQASA